MEIGYDLFLENESDLTNDPYVSKVNSKAMKT